MAEVQEGAIRVVAMKEAVLADNRKEADGLRARLRAENTFMLNIMGSPGAGKTTFLLDTFTRLPQEVSVGVIEGDIASTCDTEKMLAAGIDSVQLRTGGCCHIDVPMVEEALACIGTKADLLVIENVGNLVCPAEFDTGAHVSTMLLSVPEGYDKVFKYPLMFQVCEALVVSKWDAVELFDDFDFEALCQGARQLNPAIKIFKVSAKTGEGMEQWAAWLSGKMEENQKGAVL
ncbi:MAG: hydrogenase nickel incorporation protein HypB [Raoultibacter sp.]